MPNKEKVRFQAGKASPRAGLAAYRYIAYHQDRWQCAECISLVCVLVCDWELASREKKPNHEISLPAPQLVGLQPIFTHPYFHEQRHLGFIDLFHLRLDQ